MGSPNAANGGLNPKPSMADALQYVMDVKSEFQDEIEKYDDFLEVLKDFKNQRIDTVEVILRVKQLFKGHDSLIPGFNAFLPTGYEIKLDENNRTDYGKAIDLVKKVERRFHTDKSVYKSILRILNMYLKEHKPITDVYEELAALLEDHNDLLEEFINFFPIAPPQPSTGRTLLHRGDTEVEDRSSRA